MTRAALKIDEFNAIAFIRSSPPTSSMTNDCRIGMSNAFTVPSRKARTMMCVTVTTCVKVSAERTRARTIAETWVTTSIVRFGARSATTPPRNVKRKTGRKVAVPTIPSQIGSWVIWCTSHHCAALCIQVPTSEISWPYQKSRKLRWRSARKVSAKRVRPLLRTALPIDPPF